MERWELVGIGGSRWGSVGTGEPNGWDRPLGVPTEFTDFTFCMGVGSRRPVELFCVPVACQQVFLSSRCVMDIYRKRRHAAQAAAASALPWEKPHARSPLQRVQHERGASWKLFWGLLKLWQPRQ